MPKRREITSTKKKKKARKNVLPEEPLAARPLPRPASPCAGDGSCDEGGIGGCPDGAASVASLLTAVLTEIYLYVTSVPVTKSMETPRRRPGTDPDCGRVDVNGCDGGPQQSASPALLSVHNEAPCPPFTSHGASI